MSTIGRLAHCGYQTFEDFCDRNFTTPRKIMQICGVSRIALRRYVSGEAQPTIACIRLVEHIEQGKIPYPSWEEMRFNEFGLVVPGQKYELTVEQLKSYWHKHQHHHWLERKIRILESKLLKLEEERAKRLEVVVRMDNQDVHHWRLTG